MTKEEKRELDRVLAPWAGFKTGYITNAPPWVASESWRNSQGEEVLPIKFTESLDACFMYFIYPNQGGLSKPPAPRILNWRLSNQVPGVGTYSKPRAWLDYCELIDEQKNIWSDWREGYAEAETLSLAFCLALKEIKDGGKQ